MPLIYSVSCALSLPQRIGSVNQPIAALLELSWKFAVAAALKLSFGSCAYSIGLHHTLK